MTRPVTFHNRQVTSYEERRLDGGMGVSCWPLVAASVEVRGVVNRAAKMEVCR